MKIKAYVPFFEINSFISVAEAEDQVGIHIYLLIGRNAEFRNVGINH